MPLNFDIRSNQPELMDSPLLEKDRLNEALKDLSRVNRLLGGNKITIDAVFHHIEKSKVSKSWVVADLGCGDGEMLRLIAKKARKENVTLKLVGLDINKKCLDQARELSRDYPEITYSHQNILQLDKEVFDIDILACTLTLHHFTNSEIIDVLKKSKTLVSREIIINDLHRSKLAYYLFKIFSLFFIRSDVAEHDGLVSICRGFKKSEIKMFMQSAGCNKYKINWKWAFRYCSIIKIKNEKD